MRLTGSGVYTRPAPVPKMPQGLVELMEGLTRDVLKHNPPNVYEFCANHMQQLLLIRDGRAPKQPQTLEQKIKRAQEKVRERAEERRRKYDEEMKKLEKNTPQTSKSSDETSVVDKKLPGEDVKVLENQIVDVESNEEKKQADEVLNVKEIFSETKLKAPIHHDQDLKETLEVEIFHKPLVEATNVIASVIKDEGVDKAKVIEEDPALKNKDETATEVRTVESIVDENQAANLDSTASDINVVMDNNKSSSIEDNVIENNKEYSSEHIRSLRSVSVENKDIDSAGVSSDDKLKLEEKKVNEDTIAASVEVVDILDASKSKIKDLGSEKNNECEENQDATNYIDTILANINNDLENTLSTDVCEPKIDLAEEVVVKNNDLVTDIVNATEQIANTNELDTSNNEIKSVVIDSAQDVKRNTEEKDEAETTNRDVNILEAKALDIIKSTENNDNVKADTKKQIYDTEKGIPSKEKTYDNNERKQLLESIQNNSDTDLVESVESKEEVIQKVVEIEDNQPKIVEKSQEKNNVETPEFNSNLKSVERLAEHRKAVENNVVLKNKEVTTSKNIKETDTTNVQVTSEMPEVRIEINIDNHVTDELLGTNINQVKVENTVETLEESKLTEPDALSKFDDLPKESEKVTEVGNKDEIVVVSPESQDTPNMIVNNGNAIFEQVSQTSKNGSAPKEYESEFAKKHDDDGAIMTVDKVLVEESPGIKDDNDSVPKHSANTDTANTENVNSSHAITNGHSMKISSVSPEPNVVATYDNNEEIVSKEMPQDFRKDTSNPDQEIQDSTSITSEPKKVDDDTDSMGKTSSMDDSMTEENNDKFVESDTAKTASDTVQNKYAQSSMDLETAAVTIQKVFRSFLFKRGSTYDDASIDEGNMIDDDREKVEVEFPVSATMLNKERRALGISRMDTVLQTVNEEKSLSLSTDDSSLSSAATIIQAHVRGFLVRNRLNSNKTNSTSLVNSDGPSTSLEAEPGQKANKTVLNIHIVPEGEHFLSRDESLLTSIDLSLDGSPPSSTNLHPLGYDKSEPRKQLKREDAIQSISPPSNNSGKLSEDVESVKDMIISDSEQQKNIDSIMDIPHPDADVESRDDTPTRSTTIETVIEAHMITRDSSSSPEQEKEQLEQGTTLKSFLAKAYTDESDVVTPFEDKSSTNSDDTLRLLHSGEFHDIVLPTKVSRSDTSVVREFKNVLVYFLLWNSI